MFSGIPDSEMIFHIYQMDVFALVIPLSVLSITSIKKRFSIGFLVLKPMLCEGALRHRNTRELYSNNLRAPGPNHTQLKTKQNRKQDNKTRCRDQKR